MATTRAKFVCHSASKQKAYNTKYPVMTSFKFSPVQSSKPGDENSQFWEYTPTGSLEFMTTNLPVDPLKSAKNTTSTLSRWKKPIAR